MKSVLLCQWRHAPEHRPSSAPRASHLRSGEVVRYQRYLANAIGSVARDVPGCDRLLQLISSVESGQEDRVMYDADDVGTHDNQRCCAGRHQRQ